MLVDSSYIKLYVNDILTDEFGDEWVVGFNDKDMPEYRNDFYLKLHNAKEKNLLTQVRSKYCSTMKLKWKAMLY